MEWGIGKITGYMSMRYVVLLVLYSFFLFITGCNSSVAQDKLAPKEFDKRVKISSGHLIDVRTRDEFKEGHLQGAVNLDFYDPEFGERIKAFEKDKPIFIYCRSGSRSAKAAELFKEAGFAQVYELKGGIINWMEEQLLTVK
jgi:rhodanese-related sulfurtransferase